MTDQTYIVGRSVEEWVGASPDSPVPDRVKLRVFRKHDGRCYLSGRKIQPGEAWEVEHVKAIGLGGENRETNLAPALVEPHKEKTAADRAMMSKADRIARKHLGLWPKSKAKIRSRGFGKTRPACAPVDRESSREEHKTTRHEPNKEGQ